MNQQLQILRSNRRPLWECILDRHKYHSRWLRARVPLVFRRLSSPAHFYQRPRLLTPIVQYPLNLRLQLSWPLVSVKETRFRETITQASVIRSHRQRMLDQPVPARMQLSSLIKSYAIVSGQRDRFRSTLTHSARSLNLPTEVESGKTRTHLESAKTPGQVESSKASVHPEDEARGTFPEVVITRRPLTTVREIVSPRSLVTASDPRSFRHPAPASKSAATASAQSIGTSKSSSHTRRRETLSHAEVFQPSRPNADTASPPVPASVTTRSAPAATTESTRRTLAPVQERLYRQPAARDFASPAAHAAEKQSELLEPPSSLPQRPSMPQPALDIGQLSEEVYRHIQRKLRIERERRGL
jgi:hypothetical protein